MLIAASDRCDNCIFQRNYEPWKVDFNLLRFISKFGIIKDSTDLPLSILSPRKHNPNCIFFRESTAIFFNNLDDIARLIKDTEISLFVVHYLGFWCILLIFILKNKIRISKKNVRSN